MGAYHLICTDCGRTFAPGEIDYLCPDCSGGRPQRGILRGVLRAVYAVPCSSRSSGFAAEAGIASRRFFALLPIDDGSFLPPLPVGPTPLLAPERMRLSLGLPKLFLKDDTALPTGSHKDRASALVVAMGRSAGRKMIATASTGNAGTSLAGMCAASGLDCVILVPADAPRAKLAQMLAYGARVVRVAGTYDECFALAIEAGEVCGWYNRSTAYNPFTIEGKKTVAFEIWEQLGQQVPDVIVVPAGDGAILAGVEKGFADLRAAGWSDRTPRVIAAQAQGSAAIVAAWERERNANSQQPDARKTKDLRFEVAPLNIADTIADSIRVAAPANGRWAVRALLESGGCGIAISDDEILAAMLRLAREAGVFAEPAGAAGVAALAPALQRGALRGDESVVVLITGSGLKDTDAALRASRVPDPVQPSLAAVRQAAGE